MIDVLHRSMEYTEQYSIGIDFWGVHALFDWMRMLGVTIPEFDSARSIFLGHDRVFKSENTINMGR
jgi:hypothetical protein